MDATFLVKGVNWIIKYRNVTMATENYFQNKYNRNILNIVKIFNIVLIIEHRNSIVSMEV